MSDISDWSSTAGSNNSTSPNGFPEGMPPSGVNDSAREVMAAVRRQWEESQWFNYGHTITYGSSTTFTVNTDVTGIYTANRRIRAVGSLTGTIFGTISSSSYSSVTTVTVSWDSGSLSNETLTISLGYNPSSPSLHKESIGLANVDNTSDANKPVSTAQQAALDLKLNNSELVGAVVAFAAAIPAGWLECEGSPIRRVDYAALFSVIGTTYGSGDGVTTFNVPDLRGEFIRGYDHGRGIDPGRGLGYWQGDTLKSHYHTSGTRSRDGDVVGVNGKVATAVGVGGGAWDNANYRANSDSTGDSETRPRNIAMFYCIKY